MLGRDTVHAAEAEGGGGEEGERECKVDGGEEG